MLQRKVDTRVEETMRLSASSLPPIHDPSNYSMLPRLQPLTTTAATTTQRVATPPSTDERNLSRSPAPRQRVLAPPPSTSLLKFPSLVKPQHRIAPLVDSSSKCNQEDETSIRQGSSNGKTSTMKSHKHERKRSSDNNSSNHEEDDGEQYEHRGSRSRPPSAQSASGASSSNRASDKNRDFIRELEEKKRKEREDEARKLRRKQKAHAKMSKKILDDAALKLQRQQSQQQQSELEEFEGDALAADAGTANASMSALDDERAREEAAKRRAKAKRQKRLLKKQQALLEQLQIKQREKHEEAELEREKERRRQELVKRTVLSAIYDANARAQEPDDDGDDGDSADEVDSEISGDNRDDPAEQQSPRASARRLQRPVSSSSSLAAAAFAAGSPANALVRGPRDATASPPDEAADDPAPKPRVRDPRSDAIQRKQHAYLVKLAEQRKQKAKDEEDARALQAKRKRKIQAEALVRHQEVAKQQQEASAAAALAAQLEQAERDDERAAAATAVDVDAMVARLSRLKAHDAHVVPEARDFASWKKRHGVGADQRVFCITGCYPVIRDELERRGWFFNPDKLSPFFDLKWSLKSDDLKAVKLSKHQYVNHFFQNTAITTKVGLLHNLRQIVWHQSLDIDTVFPRAYDLNEPRDMETFVQDFRYGVAEGLLKELATIALARKGTSSVVRANAGVVDVLLTVARKKLRSKRPDSDDSDTAAALRRSGGDNHDDALEESIDNVTTTGNDELVTSLEWEVLSKCDVSKPGTLRASLTYKKHVFPDDRADAALGGDSSTSQPTSSGIDTVLSAFEKKQQRLVEKQRAEAFGREKARLAQLLSTVTAIDDTVLYEVVRLALALEKLCPQFRINGGWQRPRGLTATTFDTAAAVPPTPVVPHTDMLSTTSLNIWIVKPAGMSRGRGIRVFNNLDLLLEYADVEHHKECQWVAQKYIENPLLVCKRKFDIRQWILVTSWDPLTVWFHTDCYLRFSSEEYSIDDLSDQYVHLTNNSIQKYSDKFHDVYTTADGTIAVEGNMLHSDDFRRYLEVALGKPASFWETELQRRMKDIVVGSLQCVQDMITHRANCCELFGYDFMIDTDLTPWLIEVNSSPACDYSTPTAERYVKTGLADIIKVIVDHREYEQKKKSSSSSASEPDTGCWQRIHKGEFIGKPVSSFGADFVVKGAKVQKTKRGGAGAKTAAGAPSSGIGSHLNSNSSSSDLLSAPSGASARGGFVIVEEKDDEKEEAQQDSMDNDDAGIDADNCDGDDADAGSDSDANEAEEDASQRCIAGSSELDGRACETGAHSNLDDNDDIDDRHDNNNDDDDLTDPEDGDPLL